MRFLFKLSTLTFLFFSVAVWASNKKIKKQTEDQITYSINEISPMKSALVLGAAKYLSNGNVNPYFQNRIVAAAELYHSGKVREIIVSGDNHTVSYDEPTFMAESLIELGVPDKVIIRDYAGFRTLDSVIRAKKVFNCSELIIVSQEFHNQRAVFAANHFGIDAQGYNAKDVESIGNFTHLREIGAKFLMILDLYCFHTEAKFM
ncbi:MAG: SanA protein [Arenicella sp.]|jgi:SanA protein